MPAGARLIGSLDPWTTRPILIDAMVLDRIVGRVISACGLARIAAAWRIAASMPDAPEKTDGASTSPASVGLPWLALLRHQRTE